MAEEHRLILTLIPKVATEALGGVVSTNTGDGNAAQSGGNGGGSSRSGSDAAAASSASGQSASAGSSGSSGGGSSSSDDQSDARQIGVLHAVARLAQGFGRRIKNTEKDSDGSTDEDRERRVQELKKKLTSEAISAGTQGIKTIIQSSLGLVEDIYKQMRNASPLLQAIESMFNLAVTLFFMPLGNKLGEMLIPATMSLLDTVTDLWDSFEGKTLGDAVAWAVEKGVKIFGSYIENIANTLSGQQGIVGSMSRFLHTIAEFVQNRLEGFLEGMLNLAGWLLEHFKAFISLYVSMSTAQLGATIGSSFWYGPMGPLLGTMIGGGLGFGGTYLGLSALGLADGGTVEAKEGGTWRLLGEGGEDEFVVPRSKTSEFADAVGGGRGGIVNNWYINGVTAEELADMIDDRISRQISRSRIQSGF